jgi:hypothetical protein
MLRQEELAFIKAISTLQLSPALLRELGIALVRRKKPVVAAGGRSTTFTCGATSNAHRISSRVSAKPTSWQAQAKHSSPPTGAQRLVIGPRLCPQVHRQSRANRLPAAGNSGLLREE